MVPSEATLVAFRSGEERTEELEAVMSSEKMVVQLTWHLSWKEQEIFNGS